MVLIIIIICCYYLAPKAPAGSGIRLNVTTQWANRFTTLSVRKTHRDYLDRHPRALALSLPPRRSERPHDMGTGRRIPVTHRRARDLESDSHASTYQPGTPLHTRCFLGVFLVLSTLLNPRPPHTHTHVRTPPKVYAGLSYTSSSRLLARITVQDYRTGDTNLYPFNEITIRAVTSSAATSTDSWSVGWAFE